MAPPRVFLLSPANCGGSRARQVMSPRALSPLAEQLRTAAGAPIGDLFAFISGLYFRGKLTYARRFAAPPSRGDDGVLRRQGDRRQRDRSENPASGGVHVITTNAGLRSPETLVTAEGLRAFGAADVRADNPSYRRPLEQSAQTLAREIGSDTEVVLLGSIASPKYVDILVRVFGAQLRFPIAFVGRGDMSRGGLLLRSAAAGTELEYAPVAGAELHGPRPPKLERLPRH